MLVRAVEEILEKMDGLSLHCVLTSLCFGFLNGIMRVESDHNVHCVQIMVLLKFIVLKLWSSFCTAVRVLWKVIGMGLFDKPVKNVVRWFC